eukprot:337431-Alexandrium_andersonii.AAC.1
MGKASSPVAFAAWVATMSISSPASPGRRLALGCGLARRSPSTSMPRLPSTTVASSTARPTGSRSLE